MPVCEIARCCRTGYPTRSAWYWSDWTAVRGRMRVEFCTGGTTLFHATPNLESRRQMLLWLWTCADAFVIGALYFGRDSSFRSPSRRCSPFSFASLRGWSAGSDASSRCYRGVQFSPRPGGRLIVTRQLVDSQRSSGIQGHSWRTPCLSDTERRAFTNSPRRSMSLKKELPVERRRHSHRYEGAGSPIPPSVAA